MYVAVVAWFDSRPPKFKYFFNININECLDVLNFNCITITYEYTNQDPFIMVSTSKPSNVNHS